MICIGNTFLRESVLQSLYLVVGSFRFKECASMVSESGIVFATVIDLV